jgi:outer membrane biosynthesis protein TonB
VYFVIEHDGSVSDTRFVTRSGNVDFDYEALGAVECAGRNQRFGPLPEDMPIDRLPVQFTFEPLGTGVGGPPGRPPEGDPSPVRKPS